MLALQRLVTILDQVRHVARDLEPVALGIARFVHYPAADFAVARGCGAALLGFGDPPVGALAAGPALAGIGVVGALAERA